MSKHTPGPWVSVEKFGVFGSVKGGVIREYTNGTSQDQLFMVCSVQDDNGGQEATNANAHLIAAAPELLEALYAAEESVGDLKTLYLIRAAIAKATGSA